MLHIALHFIVPLLVAFVIFRSTWQRAFGLMLTGLAIDIDHLLANPVYDPLRCSIGFHPLHSEIAIGIYAVLFVVSLPHGLGKQLLGRHRSAINLVSIGLVIHIGLDASDCIF